MKGEAEILRRTGWLRGLLIAYGVGFFSWYFAQTLPVEQPGVLTTIAIGVGIQLAMMLLKASVRRFEKAHGLEGQLYPTALAIIDLLADAVTVLLFAISTFRAITALPADL